MILFLFLDFDGVVHPEPCTWQEAFISLPLIEAVLREFPQVEIVISSAWRLDYDSPDEALQGLKPIFSEDIRHRVVDVTGPALYLSAEDMLAGPGWHPREVECVTWLRKHRPVGTPWLAIDDRDFLFRPSSPNLMLLNGWLGFRAEDQDILRSRIQTQLGDPS